MSDKTLQQDLAEMLHIVGYVQKDSTNAYHKYTYASANAVLTKVREELSNRGICVERDAMLSGIVWHNDTGTNVVYKWVGYLIKGEQRITMCGTGQGSDKTDKATLKAQTAALKYALAGTFLISWGDDPEDEDGTKPKKAAASKPRKPRAATKKDPASIKAVIKKMGEATTLEELEATAKAAQRLTIKEQDKPALVEAYKNKKKELTNEQ